MFKIAFASLIFSLCMFLGCSSSENGTAGFPVFGNEGRESDSSQQDSDGDGLTDSEELQLGTNPSQGDSDGDGLSDLAERQIGTNPLKWDSDNDELSDAEERQLGTNPLRRDSDVDSLSDSDERRLGTHPLQADTDADDLDDGAEIRANTNPLFPDTDRDGFIDGHDVLPLGDAKVRVSVLDFLDKSDRGILHGDTNAAFTVFVGDITPVTTRVYQNVQSEKVSPVVVDVPDDVQTMRIGILVQEHAPIAAFLEGQAISAVLMTVTGVPIPIPFDSQEYSPYDISDQVGTDLDSMVLLVDLDANSSIRASGDGTADGHIGRLEAHVTIEVAHGEY